jgi:hypothetical protein
MAFMMIRPASVFTGRFSPLTTPVVMARSYPNGLPMAITFCPP